MKELRIFVALTAALLLGCSEKHPISINSGIQPAPAATKVSATVAVSFTEPITSYRHHVDAIRLRSQFHSYDFEIGPSLRKALFRSVAAAYAAPTEVSKPPSLGDYAV